MSGEKKSVQYDRPRYVDAMERRVRNASATVGRVNHELSDSAAHGAGLGELYDAAKAALEAAKQLERRVWERMHYRGN